MPAIEIGRICVKVAGRETGKKCVVVDLIDKTFILITGPKAVTDVKRRRTNITHVEPTQDLVEIKRGANDEEITEALKNAGLLEGMCKSAKPSLT
ncbi:MAG: 50S ribosomal protein L14e [Candidatus Bathyarchaeia archaeon]|jgi:large subunit ribosomal protein L14e